MASFQNRKNHTIIGSIFLLILSSLFVFSASGAHASSVAPALLQKSLELAFLKEIATINMILGLMFALNVVFLFFAAMLLDWAVNPANFLMVVNENQGIYQSWTVVRDILNMFFVLVFIFSAFCTIFQIEKFSLRNLFWTIVIMALLVNFSYPIARVIADASNVFMYFFLNQVFPSLTNDSGMSAIISSVAGIASIAFPYSGLIDFLAGLLSPSDMVIRLSISNIFMFLFSVTLMGIAVLLIIRIAVIAILIVFSPIGFVGAIFPGFSKYSQKWWGQMFQQSFFGPIMIFFIYLSLFMLQSMQVALQKSVKDLVTLNTGMTAYSEYIVTGITLTIPIIVLWMGLIAAKEMGAFGSDFVMKYANMAKDWAVKNAGGARFATRKYEKAGAKAFKTFQKRGFSLADAGRIGKSVIGGSTAGWAAGKLNAATGGRLGRAASSVGGTIKTGAAMLPGASWAGGKMASAASARFGGEEGTEMAAARMAGGLTGDMSEYQGMQMDRANKAYESKEMGSMGKDELSGIYNNPKSSEADKIAAARALAEQGELTGTQLAELAGVLGETSKGFRQLAQKVRSYDPEASFKHLADPAVRQARLEEWVRTNKGKGDFGKNLSGSALQSENLLRTVAQQGGNVQKMVAGAGDTFENDKEGMDKFKAALKNVASARAVKDDGTLGDYLFDNAENSAHRQLQSALLTHTGNFSGFTIQAGGDIGAKAAAMRAKVFQKASGDTLRNASFHDSAQLMKELVDNVQTQNIGGLMNAVQNNDFGNAAVKAFTGSATAPTRHSSYMGKNQSIQGLFT